MTTQAPDSGAGPRPPDVDAATVRILVAAGCDVIVPRTQGCCSARSAHGGREEPAPDSARSTIETLEGAVGTRSTSTLRARRDLTEYDDPLGDDRERGPTR